MELPCVEEIIPEPTFVHLNEAKTQAKLVKRNRRPKSGKYYDDEEDSVRVGVRKKRSTESEGKKSPNKEEQYEGGEDETTIDGITAKKISREREDEWAEGDEENDGEGNGENEDDDDDDSSRRRRRRRGREHDDEDYEYEKERVDSTEIEVAEDDDDNMAAAEAKAQQSSNTLAAKKTVAQGMMDVALITANANQLRYLIEFNRHNSMYYVNISLLVFSLILQVIVGLLLIFKGRLALRGESKHQTGKRINNYIVVGVFLVTVINVFIASFSVSGESSTATAPLQKVEGGGSASDN